MSQDTHLYIDRDQEFLLAYTVWGEDEVVFSVGNTYADGSYAGSAMVHLTKDEARELYESLGEHLNG